MQVHVHREALATYTPDMRAITKQAAHVIKQQLGVLASKKPAEEAAPASVHKPMPVEVPADFDAAELLPGMDCTTLKAAEDTAPLVFLYRWLELHGQVGMPGNGCLEGVVCSSMSKMRMSSDMTATQTGLRGLSNVTGPHSFR